MPFLGPDRVNLACRYTKRILQWADKKRVGKLLSPSLTTVQETGPEKKGALLRGTQQARCRGWTKTRSGLLAY